MTLTHFNFRRGLTVGLNRVFYDNAPDDKTMTGGDLELYGDISDTLPFLRDLESKGFIEIIADPNTHKGMNRVVRVLKFIPEHENTEPAG